MLRPGIAGACAVLFVHSLPAGAQTPATPDTTTKLGAVVVSATRATTTVERVPLHATIVTQAQIRNSPAQTLDQLLREIPGMNLPGAPYYATDPTGHQTRLRGVTNSKVLVLVDGVPVHDPFYSTTQWFKVPLSAIERVEVLRGGASSIWGNLAVAGVVNIVTRKPIDGEAQIDINRQSMNTTNLAASKNLVLSNGLALRVSGDVLDTDGYQTTPPAYLGTMPGKGTSSARNANAQIAAYYTPAASWSAFARVGYHQQKEDIGGYRYGENLQKSPDAAVGVSSYFGDRVKLDVRGWGQHVSFDKSNGAACYLASATSCNTTSVAAPLVQYANSHDDNPYRELGASTIVSLSEVGRMASIQTGADFRLVGGEDRAVTYNRPTTTEAASATINRTNFGRGTQRFAALFAQVRATPLPRVEATASLRYDYWTNINGRSEMTRYANNAPGSTLGGAIADSHQASLNPSLAVRFDAAERLSFRGAAYRAFRAPGLNNLYRSFSSTTSITLANPDLEPETLTGAEAGIDARSRDLTLGATVFRYDTRSLIAAYRVQGAAGAPAAVTAVCGPTLANCPATVNFNTNGQDATSRGVEIVGAWRPRSTLGVDAGYTYTSSYYTSTTNGDPVGAQLGAVPKHLETLGLTWTPTSRWSAHVNARHNDAMFLDVNHTIHQPAFTLVNVSASYRLVKQVEVYGSVTNLTDERYADNATTSAAGQTLGLLRSITSGVRVRF